MDNPKKVIKIMTVATIITAVLATTAAVTMMADGSWINILSAACAVAASVIAIVQLLLVKQAYIGYKYPDDEEDQS